VLKVVLATPRYVVIDKPSGMLSVPGIGEHKQDCAITRVQSLFPEATGPLMVHRLDTDTSGLLLVALDPDAQRALSMQFEARTVAKAYAAVLDGLVSQDEGQIDLPLRLDPGNRPFQLVDFHYGRPALTRFRVLERSAGRTRVQFNPVTGRTHQLRVHAAHPGGLNAPILGDVLYHPRGRASGPRLLLHAGHLAFNDPDTDRRVEVHAPPEF
jgi:tRNA pseudouridine32 synthase/23S rRNA pseudouridine746 synthase